MGKLRTMILAVAVAACAPLPDRDPKTGELEFSYHPPATVSEADRKDCDRQAEVDAQFAGNPHRLRNGARAPRARAGLRKIDARVPGREGVFAALAGQ